MRDRKEAVFGCHNMLDGSSSAYSLCKHKHSPCFVSVHSGRASCRQASKSPKDSVARSTPPSVARLVQRTKIWYHGLGILTVYEYGHRDRLNTPRPFCRGQSHSNVVRCPLFLSLSSPPAPNGRKVTRAPNLPYTLRPSSSSLMNSRKKNAAGRE